MLRIMMQTQMQFTSTNAYHKLENIGRKQRDCLRVIGVYGEASNYDIAQILDRPVNQVTGRVKELRELNLVEEAYRDVHPVTNRRVIYWKINNKGDLS